MLVAARRIACGYFKMSYVKFCAIIFITALLYCMAIFAAIHLLGEAFGDEMEMVMGAVICVVIFLLVSIISLKGLLSRRASRKTDPRQPED